jgi:hypothetical protein
MKKTAGATTKKKAKGSSSNSPTGTPNRERRVKPTAPSPAAPVDAPAPAAAADAEHPSDDGASSPSPSSSRATSSAAVALAQVRTVPSGSHIISNLLSPRGSAMRSSAPADDISSSGAEDFDEAFTIDEVFHVPDLPGVNVIFEDGAGPETPASPRGSHAALLDAAAASAQASVSGDEMASLASAAGSVLGGDGLQLRAASLIKWIEKMTPPVPTSEPTDAGKLQDVFLLTFKVYSSPDEFMEVLFQRYCYPIPRFNPDDPDAETDEALHVRSRVVMLLKRWLLSFGEDFVGDNVICERFQELLALITRDGKREFAQQLREAFDRVVTNAQRTADAAAAQAAQASLEVRRKRERKRSNSSARVTNEDTITEVLTARSRPSEFDCLPFTPKEVALQMTLAESILWRQVTYRELLHQAWMRANNEVMSPNIMRLARAFNRMSSLVSTSVVCEEDRAKRGQVISYWIDCALELLKLNNFNGVFEITSGLQTMSVSRLKQTWSFVKKQQMAKFAELEAVVSGRNRFSSMRNLLKSAPPPVVPYIGIFLTDLTQIEDSCQDYIPLDGADHLGRPLKPLINVRKFRDVSNVLLEIQLYQLHEYNYAALLDVHDWLENYECWADEDCYNVSLQLEPPSSLARPSGSVIAGRKKVAQSSAPSSPAGSTSSTPQSPLAQGSTNAGPSSSSGVVDEEFGAMWGPFVGAEDYPFLEKDSRVNVAYDRDYVLRGEQHGVTPLKLASLVKLVQRATSPFRPDLNLQDTLLYTFSRYASDEELLGLLIKRFNPPYPKDRTLHERYEREFVSLLQLRVFRLLSTWVKKHFFASVKSKAFTENLVQFLGTGFSGNALKGSAEALMKVVLGMCADGVTMDHRVQQAATSSGIMPMWKNPVEGQEPSLLDFHPEELARQVTVRMQSVFERVLPEELLYLCVPSASVDTYPNVKKILDISSALEKFVVDEILQRNERSRSLGVTIAHWIRVAEKSIALNNYCLAVSVLRGLSSVEVSRLKSGWAAVPPMTRSIFSGLRPLVDAEKCLYHVQMCAPPYLLHLGQRKSTLEDIERMADKLGTLINVEKFAALTGELKLFFRGMDVTYVIQRIEPLQEFLDRHLLSRLDGPAATEAGGSSRSTKRRKRDSPSRPTGAAEGTGASAGAVAASGNHAPDAVMSAKETAVLLRGIAEQLGSLSARMTAYEDRQFEVRDALMQLQTTFEQRGAPMRPAVSLSATDAASAALEESSEAGATAMPSSSSGIESLHAMKMFEKKISGLERSVNQMDAKLVMVVGRTAQIADHVSNLQLLYGQSAESLDVLKAAILALDDDEDDGGGGGGDGDGGVDDRAPVQQEAPAEAPFVPRLSSGSVGGASPQMPARGSPSSPSPSSPAPLRSSGRLESR